MNTNIINNNEITNGAKSPFFSIVIPTRNRPELLVSAIDSVLGQTCQNYELIISDNSDQPIISKNASQPVPSWFNHSQVRYVRPEKYMHMADHWEFATSYATGEYVAILTDRYIMRPSALEVLAKEIKGYKAGEPDLVVWNMRSNYSEQTGIPPNVEFTGRVESFVPRKLLIDFVKFSAWRSGTFYLSKLPRGLNSVYKRSLALDIIERHGRIFPPLAPDYTSAFLFLAYADDLLDLDLPLYISHGNQSNGRYSGIYGMRKFAAGVDFSEGCPLPLDTVFNSIVSDCMAIKKMVSPQLDYLEIDIVVYYLCNYQELNKKETQGSPMDLRGLYRLWHEGLKKLPEDQQIEIKKGIKILEEMKPSGFYILKQMLLRRYGLNRLRDYFRAKQSKWNHKRRGGVLYENVIEAACATDYLLREHIESQQQTPEQGR